jgi:NitT/TauT family transport system substrate-binding protein
VAVPPQRTEELAPVLLADALGEFEAEGLDVQLVDLAPTDAVAALAAGEVDVVVGPLDAAVFDAVADDVPLRQVLGGVVSRAPNDTGRGQTGLWIRGSAVEGNDWADLTLQPVALDSGLGNAAAHPVRLVLEPAELSLNDVVVVDAGGPEAAQMLLDGEIAAAWLDGGSWQPVSDAGGFRLIATLPASESIDGTVMATRLLQADRAVGLAYARAVIRTINTHLSGDYRDDDEVMAALEEATGRSRAELSAGPAPLFDWEIRTGTADRIEQALVEQGGTDYDDRRGEESFVDRTLAAEAVGRAET